MAARRLLFDQRFLDRHAGSIILDPAVAIVELVANCWDAYATDVVITWPNQGTQKLFSIADNGKGMTVAEFERRWGTIDYNKIVEEGSYSSPPSEMKGFPPRSTYGRNGRGRHAGFLFSDPYRVRTWRDGTEATFEVARGIRRAEKRMLGLKEKLAQAPFLRDYALSQRQHGQPQNYVQSELSLKQTKQGS